jgi:hypothetical protein
MVLPLKNARYHDIVGLSIVKDWVDVVCRCDQSLDAFFKRFWSIRRHGRSTEEVSIVAINVGNGLG